jgi:hypothetical protein
MPMPAPTHSSSPVGPANRFVEQMTCGIFPFS